MKSRKRRLYSLSVSRYHERGFAWPIFTEPDHSDLCSDKDEPMIQNWTAADRSPCRSWRTGRRNDFPLSVVVEQGWSDSWAAYRQSPIGLELGHWYTVIGQGRRMYSNQLALVTASNCCANRSHPTSEANYDGETRSIEPVVIVTARSLELKTAIKANGDRRENISG